MAGHVTFYTVRRVHLIIIININYMAFTMDPQQFNRVGLIYIIITNLLVPGFNFSELSLPVLAMQRRFTKASPSARARLGIGLRARGCIALL